MPKYSIIIPTFNNPCDLNLCLKSLESQSYRNFETIVINDGSTIDYSEVINQERNINLKYIYISNSGGPAKPRNVGISKSSGDYVCFLDSDDQWTKDYLTTVDDLIDYYDFISTGAYILENGKKTILIPKIKKNFPNSILLKGNPIITSSVTIKKEILDKKNLMFDEQKEFAGVEDLDLWFRILKTTNTKFRLIEQPLINYKVEPDSLSRKNYNQYLEKHRKLFFKFRHFVSIRDKEYYNYLNYLIAIIILKNGRFNESLKALINIKILTTNGVLLIAKYFARCILKGIG